MNDLSDAERVLTGTNEVIALNRAYARICGFDPVAGLVLSQLMCWAKKKKINFQPFYKTNAELKEECTCSLSQVKNAKEKLIKLGFVKTQIKGIPARTFYTINRKEIVEAILKLEEEETAENPVGQIQPTSWTGEEKENT